MFTTPKLGFVIFSPKNDMFRDKPYRASLFSNLRASAEPHRESERRKDKDAGVILIVYCMRHTDEYEEWKLSD